MRASLILTLRHALLPQTYQNPRSFHFTARSC